MERLTFIAMVFSFIGGLSAYDASFYRKVCAMFGNKEDKYVEKALLVMDRVPRALFTTYPPNVDSPQPLEAGRNVTISAPHMVTLGLNDLVACLLHGNPGEGF